MCLSDDFYHHFIDKETKVQAAQIIQVLKSRISESKSSVLCMDQVKNFLFEKTTEAFWAEGNVLNVEEKRKNGRVRRLCGLHSR